MQIFLAIGVKVIFRTTAKKALRISTTTIPTEYRFPTFMHDPQFCVSIAWQNVAYNQPPRTSYYVGDDMVTPPRSRIRYTQK